jgi:hypothetical protein
VLTPGYLALDWICPFHVVMLDHGEILRPLTFDLESFKLTILIDESMDVWFLCNTTYLSPTLWLIYYQKPRSPTLYTH